MPINPIIPTTNALFTAKPSVTYGYNTLRHVTNRTFLPNNGQPNSGVFTRSWQMSYVPITTISVILPNWYLTNFVVESASGGPTTWQVWLEYPVGAYTRLTFSGGAPSITTAAMINLATDVQQLPFTIPAYTKFYLWMGKVTTGGGSTSFSNAPKMRDYANGDLMQSNTTSFVPGVITDDGNVDWLCPPLAVLSYSNQHIWCVLGDSNIIGQNESINDIMGGRGWFGRALSQVGPQLNLGVSGDSIALYLASHALRHDLIQVAGVDRLILQYAGNDIMNNSVSSANALLGRASIRALYSNMPIVETTVAPVTNSSDGWKTAANQTQYNGTANTQRLAFNAAMRKGIPGVVALIDVASVMETSTAYEQSAVVDGGVLLPYMVDAGTGSFHTSSQGNSSPSLQQKTLSAVWLAGV